MTIQDDDQKRALQELMEVEGGYKEVKENINSQLKSIKSKFVESQKKMKDREESERTSSKKHVKRQQKKLDDYIDQISEASKMDFKKASESGMTPQEIDHAMIGVASEVEPKIPYD